MGENSIADEVRSLFGLRDDLIANPYPLYRRMLDDAPVVEVDGTLVVSRFDFVNAILSNPVLFSSRNRQSYTEQNGRDVAPEDLSAFEYMLDFEMSLTARMDNPEHSHGRKMVTKPFNPHEVSLQETDVRHLIENRLNSVGSDGRVQIDFLSDFASHVPINVITDMFGIPVADRPLIRVWTDALAQWRGSKDSLRHAYEFALEMREYLRATILESVHAPQTELLKAIRAADVSADHLSFRLVGLIMAGAETTTNLFTGGALLLLQQEGLWKQLHDDPSLIPAAVEELIRLVSPVQFVERYPTQDTEIGGYTLPKGTSVLVMLGAANRDPGRFEDPDVLNLFRPGLRRHLGFGYGVHLCLGASLARLEAVTAFTEFISRYPDAHLAETELAWRHNLQLRSLSRLMLNLS
jgi:pimeloyl-[acyl-carrier protein] synthase